MQSEESTWVPTNIFMISEFIDLHHSKCLVQSKPFLYFSLIKHIFEGRGPHVLHTNLIIIKEERKEEKREKPVHTVRHNPPTRFSSNTD